MKLVLLSFVAAAALCCVCALTPCCVSRKFSALMMRLQATLPTGATDPFIEDIYSTIEYDADAKMERITGHILDTSTGQRSEYTEYKDFKHSKRYTVTSSGCIVEPLNELMIVPCVAANFSMLQQYTIGSGAHTVPVTSWEGPYLGSLWMNIHFVDGSCEPVSLQIYGPTPDNAAKLLYAYQFANMKQGHLSSNDVFTTPDSCKHASQTVG
ncbi:uncharacterized protein LOC132717836 [Ruditapes philippinarum]|uniref:uncharacterized protein LOC132717836 n=1 Tax=Ruditapes philippinarum TaxID=129788 RepID=UPI00295C1082|nr:uncharacterized protein LOC132717836 [Ruditapes philippinarum]